MSFSKLELIRVLNESSVNTHFIARLEFNLDYLSSAHKRASFEILKLNSARFNYIPICPYNFPLLFFFSIFKNPSLKLIYLGGNLPSQIFAPFCSIYMYYDNKNMSSFGFRIFHLGLDNLRVGLHLTLIYTKGYLLVLLFMRFLYENC